MKEKKDKPAKAAKEPKKPKEKKPKTKRTSIGGQALLEGVMMRGVNAMALAVRSPEGDILIDAKRLKGGRRWYARVPVLRGLIAFFASLVSGVKVLVKSASVSAPDEKAPGKGWMGFAVFLGLALGIGLFFVIPWALKSFVLDIYLGHMLLLSVFIEGVIRLVIFILYLFFVSLIKDIRRTFAYHGAEHRTINCFEKNMEMTVENLQKCSTRHNRCGTTFLFFVMVISILVFSLMTWLMSLTPLKASISNKFLYNLVMLLIRLASLPVVAGVSYELLKGLAALPDNWFTTALRAPGLALQRLTTYKPDDEMAEVALAAFLEVYKMDADKTIGDLEFGQFRFKDLREKTFKRLSALGADADAETDWIFCDVTNLKRSELSSLRLVTNEQFKKIKAVLTRRETGEPLWHILGYCEFFGNRLFINKNALIPRFSTETLCERALEEINGRKNGVKVLDLCSGSGAVALTVAKNSTAAVTAADISDAALTVAANNLEGVSAELIKSDLFGALEGREFDVIISNPPYIPSADIENLAVEVKSFEPAEALDGGADGLDFYRKIASEAGKYLSKDGCLLLEVGITQAGAVKELLSAGFSGIEIFKDLDGIERVIKAYKK
jgi:release factor-specific protein-(glutamine-N5) methyltransferase